MIRTIDITIPLSTRLPPFPGDPAFEMAPTHRMADGAPYNLSRLSLGTHSGTHVDAPFHFRPDGATVDKLSLDILIGRVKVVELLVRERIDRADVAALDLHDEIRLLFKTRMSGQLQNPEFQPNFVHLTPEAATHLVAAGIKLVGIDSPSVEKFGRDDFAVHHTLLRAGVVIVEALDLSNASPGIYDMTCLPLLVAGADGAPARVVLRTRS
jgi:arylformamidase